MNLKIKDYIFIVLVVIGLLLLGYQKLFGPKTEDIGDVKKINMVIGDSKLMVVIARSEQERYKGLSGIEAIQDDQGMLFIHDDLGRHAYAMRDMLFDLDLVFINDEKVVDIARGVSIMYEGEIKGGADYNYVLEVNADWTKRQDVNIGDEVKIEGL